MVHENTPSTLIEGFGDRLREERIRLACSQTALAQLGGVKKLSQIAYEQGRRAPDARYLVAAYQHGVDVCYLLTGERTREYVARMDKKVTLAVATVVLEWLQTTAREVTPQLLADVLTILYDGGVQYLDAEHMADQLRAVG